MALMLVIADDLTGAADCGVACAGHGLRTILVLGDSVGEVSADVLSVDGDTRRLPPDKAAAETARLLQRYLPDGDPLLYKKIDSTMRGNVGDELAATLAVRRSFAGTHELIVTVLAPAFPAAGRTTSGGHQYLNAVPLNSSLLTPNDHAPACSDIAALLRLSHLQPQLLALDLVRAGGGALSDEMQTAARHADVLVCDAETDDDLGRIAGASMALGRHTVWAGSAGLAKHLPSAAGLPLSPVTRLDRPSAAGPLLFVVGSGSSVAREQVQVLAFRSDTIVIRVPLGESTTGDQSQRWRTCGFELDRAISSGRNVAFVLDQATWLDPSAGTPLTTALAATLRPLANRVGALVATGGETARAVLDAWGVKSLQLIGEVETGLPFSVTSGWSRELPVLTKAGGFGTPESLLRCLEFLRKGTK